MSKKDYYEILGLLRDCSQEEIADAYRRLSLKYHPNNTSPDDAGVNDFLFNQVAEAYEVLSDPNKKGIFDIYGKDGLYKGILDREGNLKGGYKYAGNANEIFEKFMGTTNPFGLIRDSDKPGDDWGTAFASHYGGKHQPSPETIKPIKAKIECSLEELYNGANKELKYKKKTLNYDKRTTIDKIFTVNVEIFPGYCKDTIITFKGMGNEVPGMSPGDLLVQIVEKKNPNFKRSKTNDLIYTHRITLAQALNSEPVKILTLDNRNISISMDEIISPQTVKIIKGEGMPIYSSEQDNKPLQKGDLYIKFDIRFPEYISPEKKEEITNLLTE